MNLHTHRENLSGYLTLYGIHDARIQALGPNRFYIDGPNAVCEAKLVHPTSAALRLSLTDALARFKFRETQRFLNNLYDERIVSIDSSTALYVTDTWSTEVDWSDATHIREAVTQLARLHAAIAQCSPRLLETYKTNLQCGYGVWVSRLKGKISILETERMRASTQGSRDVLDWLAPSLALAHQVVAALLNSEDYLMISREAESAFELAFGHVTRGTFAKTSQGKMRMFQFGDPVLDSPLLDLATLCADLCAFGHTEELHAAIEGYHAILPVSKSARRVVQLYAVFPHRLVTMARQLRPTNGKRDMQVIDGLRWLHHYQSMASMCL